MSKKVIVEKLQEGVIKKQIFAIMMRDIKLTIREAKYLSVLFFTQLLVPCGFYYMDLFQGRIGAYYCVIVLNSTLSRIVVTNHVEERAKKFRSTFKLMGKHRLFQA